MVCSKNLETYCSNFFETALRTNRFLQSKPAKAMTICDAAIIWSKTAVRSECTHAFCFHSEMPWRCKVKHPIVHSCFSILQISIIRSFLCLFRRAPKLPDGQFGLAAALRSFPLIYVTSDSLTLTYMAVGEMEDRYTICGQVQ